VYVSQVNVALRIDIIIISGYIAIGFYGQSTVAFAGSLELEITETVGLGSESRTDVIKGAASAGDYLFFHPLFEPQSGGRVVVVL
jgi:hypothetical protein